MRTVVLTGAAPRRWRLRQHLAAVGNSRLPRCCALLPAVLLALVPPSHAESLTIEGSQGIQATIDPASGRYEVRSGPLQWVFAGTLESLPTDVVAQESEDSSGSYHELRFRWHGQASFSGRIRAYVKRPVVLFSVTTEEPLASAEAIRFPRLTQLPQGLRGLSYGSAEFSPPRFTLEENGSPWLLFDEQGHAAVLSPASHFLLARLRGDGTSEATSALNAGVGSLPAGFTHSTLLVLGTGINTTWSTWGEALAARLGAHRPANDADIGLRYLGYWTDHGAQYYYNYDRRLGYAGTLRAVIERYRRERVPVRYLQLDSWWYSKTLTDPEGHVGKPTNPRLPLEEWNRYGGLLRYEAHPALFPQGLAAFQRELGLPLITHSRWIDPASPYHQSYGISGLAPVDPRWWQDIMAYLAAAHVLTYEQDWLNVIYEGSPELGRSLEAGTAFSDGMARAARDQGLTLQYSMALPRQLLQGAAYDNLTTARVSLDRFKRPQWDAFLYTSRLASALGIWPWTDVFMSGETDNLLLATLSAGMVGIGDKLGAEDREQLLRAVRPDGVIVKPDTAVVPIDAMYALDAAQERSPMIAFATTDHGRGLRTAYVFSYRRTWRHAHASFTPQEVGMSGDACVYDARAGTLRRLAASARYTFTLFPRQTAYFVVAPVSQAGISLLGDAGKLVPAGRKRIASLVEDSGSLTATVVFAPEESTVRLFGCATRRPRVSALKGTSEQVVFDAASGRFEVQVHPDPQRVTAGPGDDPVTQAVIALR